MKQAGLALLWIVATVGGAVLLAKLFDVGIRPFGLSPP